MQVNRLNIFEEFNMLHIRNYSHLLRLSCFLLTQNIFCNSPIMKHFLTPDSVQIEGPGIGIINDEPVECPTSKPINNFIDKAKYNPQHLPYFINGPFEFDASFPHFRNQYHILDDIYILYGQFESHRFHNKELYLPAKDKASTSDDILFHGYTVQSFLTFIHSLSESAFKLVLLPNIKDDPNPHKSQIPIEQGLCSSSNVIFLTFPDTVESITAFLMGICWHIAGLTFGYFIRCPLATNPYLQSEYKPSNNKQLTPNIPLIEYQLNHLWVTVGLRGYLYIKLLKQVFGPSFVQYYIYKTIDNLLKIELAGNVPSIAEFYVVRLNGSKVINNLDTISAHNYYISKCALIMNGLSKCVGEQALDTLITNLIKKCDKFDSTSNDDIPYLNTLGTNQFISKLKKLTTYNFQSYIKQYIFYPGLPILDINWVYNKRKGAIEIDINQHKTIPGGPIFTGPLAIKIQEPDGSYEHVLDVQKQSQQFEVRYNTRYKRVKRFRNVDTEDVMFHRDINGIVVSEYTKPEDEAMEYLRVDCDHLWIGQISLKQSEYMVAQMVLKELDMNTQMQGIAILSKSTEPSAATTLFRIICNHRYHPFIRSEAAFALQYHHVIGMYYLLQYIKRFWCENDNVDPFNSPHAILSFPLFIHQSEIGVKLELEVKQPALYKYLYFTPLVLKSNDFSHFGQYHVATSAIQALAMIRLPNTSITIPSIRESQLGMSNSAIVQRLRGTPGIGMSTSQVGMSSAISANPSHVTNVQQSNQLGAPTTNQLQHQQLQQYHQQMNQQTMQVLDLPDATPGISPPLIRKLAIDLLKCNDNLINQFNHDNYTACLIHALYHAFIPNIPNITNVVVENEEIIGHSNNNDHYLEILHNIKLAYSVNKNTNTDTTQHPSNIDYILFKKALFIIESIRIYDKQPMTTTACIHFISHCMLLDFIPIDIQRILPYTMIEYHTLVRLQSFESLLLLGALEMMTFVNYYVKCIQGDASITRELQQLLYSYLLLRPILKHKMVLLQLLQSIPNTFIITNIIAILDPSKVVESPVVDTPQQPIPRIKLKIKSTLYKHNQSQFHKIAYDMLLVMSKCGILMRPIPDISTNENGITIKSLYAMLASSSDIEMTFISNVMSYYKQYLQCYTDTVHYNDIMTNLMEMGMVYHNSNNMRLLVDYMKDNDNIEIDKVFSVINRIKSLELTEIQAELDMSDTVVDKYTMAKVSTILNEIVPVEVKEPDVVVTGPNVVLLDILHQIEQQPFALCFRQPIDPVALGIPNYSDIVKEPMDLSTIYHKIINNKDYGVMAFKGDMKLMIENCYLFNDGNSQVVVDCQLMESFYRAQWGIYYPTIDIEGFIGPNRPDVKIRETMEHLIQCSNKGDAISSTQVKTIVNNLRKRPDAFPFLVPVDPIKLNIPHYRTIVKEPMDLSTILRKNSTYKTVGDLLNDLELMLYNCFIFNPPGNSIYLAGIELRQGIKMELRKLSQVELPVIVDSQLSAHFIGLLEMQILGQFINKIRLKKSALPFLNPVDVVALNIPQYLTIIETPMDFNTLEVKLKNGAFSEIQELFSWVDVIFENCFKFNKPEHSVSVMGKQLQQYCRKEQNGILGQIQRKLDKLEAVGYEEDLKNKIYSVVGKMGLDEMEMVYEGISTDYGNIREARDALYGLVKDKKERWVIMKKIDEQMMGIVFGNEKKRKNAEQGKRKKSKY